MTAAARPHRPLLAYAVASVALATLGACTGGDPGPADTTAPPASPSASTSSAQPTTTTSAAPSPSSGGPNFPAGLPEAAKAHTPKGAEAFTRHVLDQVNRAWTKPDPEALNGLCLASSKACTSWTSDAKSLSDKNHHYDGNPVRALAVKSRSSSSGTQNVSVQLIQERRNIVDQNGSVVSTDQRKQLELIALLTWSKAGWQVASFGTATS